MCGVIDRQACPFCCLSRTQIQFENQFAVAFLDSFPVTAGHTLVVPTRHLTSVFDLSAEEQGAVWSLVRLVRDRLVSEQDVDGCNIGINDGVAAGQTVMHAHVHVIPRRRGDVVDPRGGVRWIIPDRAAYWTGDHE